MQTFAEKRRNEKERKEEKREKKKISSLGRRRGSRFHLSSHEARKQRRGERGRGREPATYLIFNADRLHLGISTVRGGKKKRGTGVGFDVDIKQAS